MFSAGHLDSLRQSVHDYERYIESHPSALADVAHTLGARREHLSQRAFCVTDGKLPLDISKVMKSKSPSQITFVFTGQGAQWAGMGKELLEDSVDFRSAIRAMDKALARLSSAPPWTVEGKIKALSLVLVSSLTRQCRRALETRGHQSSRESGVLSASFYGGSGRPRKPAESLGRQPNRCFWAFKRRDWRCVCLERNHGRRGHRHRVPSGTSEQATESSWRNGRRRTGSR